MCAKKNSHCRYLFVDRFVFKMFIPNFFLIKSVRFSNVIFGIFKELNIQRPNSVADVQLSNLYQFGTLIVVS